MPTFPDDRFDHIPDELERVGAHRLPPRRGRGWIVVGWAALATVVLIGLGVVALFIINDKVSFDFIPPAGTPSAVAPTPTIEPPQPTPTAVTPIVDPNVGIRVLNGTATGGLASGAAARLTAAGWTTDIAVGNADNGDASETIVYYQDSSQEAAALGIVQALGVGRAELSNAFATSDEGDQNSAPPITVLLGSDYVE